MVDVKTGRCLCGAVQVSAKTANTLQACHCQQCQQWTGGGPLYAIRVQDLVVTGEDNIASYRASGHGERAFCSTCGSKLWWKMQGRPVAFTAVGLFDDQSGWTLAEEIFVDRRPDWCPAFPNATQSTEAEQMQALQDFLKQEQKP